MEVILLELLLFTFSNSDSLEVCFWVKYLLDFVSMFSVVV